MLIWIKAPCVAVGVLASFVLLLSTVVSEQVNLNETSDDLSVTSDNLRSTTLAQPESTDSETLQLMTLSFARSLSNPCSWLSTPPHINIEGHRARFIEEFFRFVSHYAELHKKQVGGMLQNHTITGCSSLHVHNLPHTPTLQELQEMNTDEALNKIYLSLLVHSAYSYFVHHQFVTSNVKCLGDIEGEQSLANQSLDMAMKQKGLACYVRVGMSVLGYHQENVLPLLNDTISDLSQCSRRALRDCQVMKSMYNFLGIVSYYTGDDATTHQSDVGESSSDLSSTAEGQSSSNMASTTGSQSSSNIASSMGSQSSSNMASTTGSQTSSNMTSTMSGQSSSNMASNIEDQASLNLTSSTTGNQSSSNSDSTVGDHSSSGLLSSTGSQSSSVLPSSMGDQSSSQLPSATGGQSSSMLPSATESESSSALSSATGDQSSVLSSTTGGQSSSMFSSATGSQSEDRR